MAVDTPPGPTGFAPPHQHPRRERDAGRVLVLNATYEPINVCTVRRATVLLLKQKAELVERATWTLRSEHTQLPRPMVIRLVSYVKVPRDTHRRKITRRAVFARDGWACQYCGARSNLTVDHVIPRSKGGTSTWENIVASCAPCNRRKGDLLPAQANMVPRHAPRAPNPHVFIHVASPTIPSAWKQWLPGAVSDTAGRSTTPGTSSAAGVPEAA
jgi:5-methylcytosine-specific restriction endonuclease McrA